MYDEICLLEKLIKDIAATVDRVIVLEELDLIIEDHCRRLGIQVSGKDIFPICGEFSQNLIRECMGLETSQPLSIEDPIPGRLPVMCAGCPHSGIFRPAWLQYKPNNLAALPPRTADCS